ncbi:MAG: hypothetical protein ABIV21_06710 [Pyrinomonadaceae bacterium]
MTKWPTTFILLIAFAGGVFAGLPLHPPTMPMKCCDKARSRDKTRAASLARLRCAMDCSETTPVSSGLSFNFAPSSVAIEASIASQIADLFRVQRSAPTDAPSYRSPAASRSFQPRYIQYHSFLI